MPSSIRVLFLVALVALTHSAGSAGAAEAPAAPERVVAPASPAVVVTPPAAPDTTAASAVAAKPAARIVRTPLMLALTAVMDDETTQLQPLLAELAATHDASQSLALQRRIEQVKQGTELQLLRVQSGFARAAGNVDLADRIDAAIAEQLQPRLRLESQPRTAPVAGDAH
jgi:hypothetical protein